MRRKRHAAQGLNDDGVVHATEQIGQAIAPGIDALAALERCGRIGDHRLDRRLHQAGPAVALDHVVDGGIDRVAAGAGTGQKVITPAVGRTEAVAWFREQEAAGLVEGFDAFRDGLVVERNASDRQRLDFLLPTDTVNQLRVIGAQLSFLL